MSTRTALFLSFLLASAATAAEAQAPPSPATPPQATAPNQNAACAPSSARGTPAPDGVTTGAAEPLGDKLAKSGGVLCPPSTADSEIHAPTPEGGNTPVIPPPGSPGGNPNVVPK
jgi:hypothetical protein